MIGPNRDFYHVVDLEFKLIGFYQTAEAVMPGYGTSQLEGGWGDAGVPEAQKETPSAPFTHPSEAQFFDHALSRTSPIRAVQIRKNDKARRGVQNVLL